MTVLFIVNVYIIFSRTEDSMIDRSVAIYFTANNEANIIATGFLVFITSSKKTDSQSDFPRAHFSTLIIARSHCRLCGANGKQKCMRPLFPTIGTICSVFCTH